MSFYVILHLSVSLAKTYQLSAIHYFYQTEPKFFIVTSLFFHPFCMVSFSASSLEC